MEKVQDAKEWLHCVENLRLDGVLWELPDDWSELNTKWCFYRFLAVCVLFKWDPQFEKRLAFFSCEEDDETDTAVRLSRRIRT